MADNVPPKPTGPAPPTAGRAGRARRSVIPATSSGQALSGTKWSRRIWPAAAAAHADRRAGRARPSRWVLALECQDLAFLPQSVTASTRMLFLRRRCHNLSILIKNQVLDCFNVSIGHALQPPILIPLSHIDPQNHRIRILHDNIVLLASQPERTLTSFQVGYDPVFSRDFVNRALLFNVSFVCGRL